MAEAPPRASEIERPRLGFGEGYRGFDVELRHAGRIPKSASVPQNDSVACAISSCYRLSMIGPSEIERMSVEERLQAIELLWDSISWPGDTLASPAWHGKVLAARRAKVDDGKGQFLSMSELRDRLKPSS